MIVTLNLYISIYCAHDCSWELQLHQSWINLTIVSRVSRNIKRSLNRIVIRVIRELLINSTGSTPVRSTNFVSLFIIYFQPSFYLIESEVMRRHIEKSKLSADSLVEWKLNEQTEFSIQFKDHSKMYRKYGDCSITLHRNHMQNR